MPVLGADPDAPVEAFPEFAPRVFCSKPVRQLTDFFAYHKNMRMNQRFNEQDRAIMNRFFSRSLKSGYSEETLSSLVDMFWQTWGGETQAPALVFVSNEMQEKLMDRVAPQRPTDATLAWLYDGMPDDPDLFYDSAEVRASVLLDATSELLLRYPDVVAALILVPAHLRYVRDVVRWHLGELDFCPINNDPWTVGLPDELQRQNRSPSKLRRKYDTVQRAIARIPRK